ncbi:MAG: MBL fold metallo-hydrolase [Candidatus Thorarchaeota archaeon]|nr:MBL fold metallo-hydrolase [Candidatus Thorarchaeota archaeon]
MSEYPVHIEIMPKVHLIRGENRARFPEANTLVIDDEILTLVDAGSSMKNIETALKNLRHEIADIDRIILTHFHIDHKHHASKIQEISNCEILCHPLAEKGVRSFDGLVEYYGIEGNKYYNSWRNLLDIRFPDITGNYDVTGTFSNREPVDSGEIQLIPIHLPGHTLDHTCFGINGYKVLFLVDIDLTSFGPWYGNEVSDIEVFKESVDQVIAMKPKIGISSHLINPVTDNLAARLQTFRSVFDEREKRILENIGKGIDTIEKLAQVPTIYPRIPMEVYLAFEVFMLEKHIALLIRDEKIIEDDGHFRLE